MRRTARANREPRQGGREVLCAVCLGRFPAFGFAPVAEVMCVERDGAWICDAHVPADVPLRLQFRHRCCRCGCNPTDVDGYCPWCEELCDCAGCRGWEGMSPLSVVILKTTERS